jgi:hypothetical protein
MITLNEIAYNIKNLAYGGSTSTENSISLRQIKHWIHYHRAKLIADNINKGITNNQALWQKMSLTARNSTSSTIKNFYDAWDAKDIDASLSAPTVTGEFLSNLPKNAAGDRLNGEWLVQSSLSTGENGWADGQQRSFYGEEISSSQVRGDFRNFGSHSFWTPRPLQLKNDAGIVDVSVERYVYFPDDPGTPDDNEQAGSYAKKSIILYRKEYGNFDEYNKFTDNNKPYYIQETAKIDRDNNANGNYIALRQLQVSPNYHGGLSTPVAQKLFWKYRGVLTMILENPTEIDMMYGFWYETETKWDDATTPYPIPMEWVSDLIQRVIQVEMQAELKTTPDIITDGLDDNLKRKSSGAQVQR